MSDLTQQEYDREVEGTALTILDKIEKYPEDYGDDEWKAVHEVVDHHDYVTWNHNFLEVLKYSEEGPREWKTYVEDDEKNHFKVLEAMAYTAFRADVYESLNCIREAREMLGDCTDLIGDHPIWDDGVELEYEYKKGYGDYTKYVTYTLESVSRRGNEWRVIDPDGNQCNVISPDVMVENGDGVSPAIVFKRKLDNICARQEHERGKQMAENV